MSRVIGTVTINGFSFDLTEMMSPWGSGYGWSEGPGPNMRGCTGYDTIGEAVDGALRTLRDEVKLPA